MACCCDPTMCANSGGHLDSVWCNIGNLINPFAPGINKRIACAGKPQTLTGKLGITSGQFLLFGGLLFGMILLLHHK